MKQKADNPTKDPEFQRVLGNLLKAPPKHQKDMKVGKRATKKSSKEGKSRAKSER